jgi:hypothetical protein
MPEGQMRVQPDYTSATSTQAGFQRVRLGAKLWIKPLISLYNPVSFKPGK